MNSILPDQIAVSDERDLGAFIPSFLDDFGLDPYQFRIYCRLARRAGAGGQCWESLSNMSAACRMSRRKLIQVLSSLLDFGMIRCIKRPGKSDLYCLTNERHWASPLNHTGAPHAPHRCTTCTTPVHHMHHTGAPHAPKGIPSRQSLKAIQQQPIVADEKIFDEESRFPSPDSQLISDTDMPQPLSEAEVSTALSQVRALGIALNPTIRAVVRSHFLAVDSAIANIKERMANGERFKCLEAAFVHACKTGLQPVRPSRPLQPFNPPSIEQMVQLEDLKLQGLIRDFFVQPWEEGGEVIAVDTGASVVPWWEFKFFNS